MSTLIQRSFTGGELSPAVQARADLEKYSQGAATLRNMMVMPHGGTQNRPGTRLVGSTVDSTKQSRLIPFIYNAAQTFMLEFGDLYMRVIRNGAYITDSTKNITAITKASPGVFTSVAHGFTTGEELQIASVIGMVEVNSRSLVVVVLSADMFKLRTKAGVDLDTSTFTTYVSGGTASRIYKLTHVIPIATVMTLKYVQSADSMVMVSNLIRPYELLRISDTNWTLTAMTFAPSQVAPTAVVLNASTAGGPAYNLGYYISAISATTGEESLPVGPTVVNSPLPIFTNPVGINFTGAAGAGSYNIYKETYPGSGFYGFLFNTLGISINDIGLDPSPTKTFITARDPISGDFPGTVSYCQQRLMFGNTVTYVERVYGSRTGKRKNFTVSKVSQDDDAITFDVTGSQVNAVQHLADIGKLIILSTGAELSAEGAIGTGVLTPGNVNTKPYSRNGASALMPLVIGGMLFYVQARGTMVRSLGFDITSSSYRGDDMSIFARHMFDGYALIDWAYQNIPSQCVWAVRSDGALLGLTFIREHQIFGWHRHDTDGIVESVAVVPEGGEDVLYLQVKRTIAGVAQRYIERMYTRVISDIRDSVFMDSALAYDGRNYNAGATTRIINSLAYTSGSTGLAGTVNSPSWTDGVALALGIYGITVSDYRIGDVISVTGADGSVVNFTILDTTVAAEYWIVMPDRTVPASLQGSAAVAATITTWSRKVATVRGLWHLEGKALSVLGDGFVYSSPNNSKMPNVLTVSGGSITLPTPAAVIQAGLPYLSDVETLDMESVQGETMIDKQKQVSKVTFKTEKTRSLWVGSAAVASTETDQLKDLYEAQIRKSESYDLPINLLTDSFDVIIKSDWSKGGRVFVRQVDPLPMAILSLAPYGSIPLRP